ncbi:sporulation protein rmd1 [Chrysochromulina tobinii]|uniref:Sporulation protein rmd1 n=1 Tax=Chrysochromulina tobinii TaxID=1460289 RepID=A0A0M0JY79_9EUKA|nr:sporulation protein rmd1 [Chrysochromulina tobinii]|eukprot:KOO31519.1 sporulation protein rmd1 [Chrysochromulina sp. CCMP291]
MERILGSVKRIVRQGRPSLLLRFLPPYLGGVESGARTMQRLLLMREFNFDDSIMSTPDWLWEQPEREAMYDAMVSEYEIEDRIEAINQQLDYAQATMQTLKDDAHHQHSTFLEYAIVLLIAFEVLVEIHSLGWIEWPSLLDRNKREQTGFVTPK